MFPHLLPIKNPIHTAVVIQDVKVTIWTEKRGESKYKKYFKDDSRKGGGGKGMEAAQELDMRKYFYKSTNQFKGVFFYKQRINYLNEVRVSSKDLYMH